MSFEQTVHDNHGLIIMAAPDSNVTVIVLAQKKMGDHQLIMSLMMR